MTEAHSASTAQDTPKPSAAEIRTLVTAEIERASRLWHVALVLGALTVTGLYVAFLLTEPGLPPRARGARAISFAVLVGIGSSWSVFLTWLVSRRGIPLAKDKVLHARLAATFAMVFTLGVWAVGRWGPAGRPGYVWMAGGLAMTVVAVVLMFRAKYRFDELSRRRAELERTLAG